MRTRGEVGPYVQGDHSGCVKPTIDNKKRLRFSRWASYKNGTFVLMSTEGLTQPEWSPCTGWYNRKEWFFAGQNVTLCDCGQQEWVTPIVNRPFVIKPPLRIESQNKKRKRWLAAAKNREVEVGVRMWTRLKYGNEKQQFRFNPCAHFSRRLSPC